MLTGLTPTTPSGINSDSSATPRHATIEHEPRYINLVGTLVAPKFDVHLSHTLTFAQETLCIFAYVGVEHLLHIASKFGELGGDVLPVREDLLNASDIAGHDERDLDLCWNGHVYLLSLTRQYCNTADVFVYGYVELTSNIKHRHLFFKKNDEIFNFFFTLLINSNDL